MEDWSSRLYLSTIGEDAAPLARTFGLGLEIAEYCTAWNLDEFYKETDASVRKKMQGIDRFILPAPFNELCPAAIDRQVRAVAVKRYEQTLTLARSYGIRRIVIHGGFIPTIYYDSWFCAESVAFWRDFLSCVPGDTVLLLENVMEPTPGLLRHIAEEVGDPRFRLCLDVGHAFSAASSSPVEEWVRVSAPLLSHVHLHDNLGERDLHLPLGEGSMDLNRILSLLWECGEDITYTLENSLAAPSLAWLRDHNYL